MKRTLLMTVAFVATLTVAAQTTTGKWSVRPAFGMTISNFYGDDADGTEIITFAASNGVNMEKTTKYRGPIGEILLKKDLTMAPLSAMGKSQEPLSTLVDFELFCHALGNLWKKGTLN